MRWLKEQCSTAASVRSDIISPISSDIILLTTYSGPDKKLNELSVSKEGDLLLKKLSYDRLSLVRGIRGFQKALHK